MESNASAESNRFAHRPVPFSQRVRSTRASNNARFLLEDVFKCQLLHAVKAPIFGFGMQQGRDGKSRRLVFPATPKGRQALRAARNRHWRDVGNSCWLRGLLKNSCADAAEDRLHRLQRFGRCFTHFCYEAERMGGSELNLDGGDVVVEVAAVVFSVLGATSIIGLFILPAA